MTWWVETYGSFKGGNRLAKVMTHPVCKCTANEEHHVVCKGYRLLWVDCITKNETKKFNHSASGNRCSAGFMPVFLIGTLAQKTI